MALPIGYSLTMPIDLSAQSQAKVGEISTGGSTINFKSSGISTGVIIAAVIGLVVFLIFSHHGK